MRSFAVAPRAWLRAAPMWLTSALVSCASGGVSITTSPGFAVVVPPPSASPVVSTLGLRTEPVIPGVGVLGLALGSLTRGQVIERLGEPRNVVDHAGFTVELVYANGLRAFYCRSDPSETIILLRVDEPMRARTPKGITRGVSKVSDVLRVYGDRELSLPPEGRAFVETPGLLFEFDLRPGEAARPLETEGMNTRTVASMSVVLPNSGLFACSAE